MRYPFRGAALILTVAAACLSGGCGTTVVRRRVERRAERRLPSLLGPADRYAVRIVGTRDAELVRGQARRVEVEGDRIRARGQMLVDSLRLSIHDLRYTGGEPYPVSIGRSDLAVEFTDQALNDYLAVYQPRYQPSVRFEPDRVHVRMVYGFLGKPTPISAVGRFQVEDGVRLHFEAEKVDLSFINQPGFGERFVEERVNPLLDMTEIDFPARLESVTVLAGRIRACGSATIPRNAKGLTRNAKGLK